MSSVRVQKYFEAMPEQIKRLSGYTGDARAALRWSGRVTAGPNAGKDACIIDFTSATWADGNKRAIILAEPASDLNNTAAMKTQSHAAGHSIDGSVRFKVYCETPEAWTDAQAAFIRNVEHHLRGQLGAPVEVFYGTNDVEPTLQGVNGAGADSASTSAGTDIPGLWPSAGGV
jgi:hypothetical protein